MTETTEIRMREIHGRTRRYRARYEAWRLSWLALCGLILLTGIGLLAFALGVATTVLCVRLKDRTARRMPEDKSGGHEHEE